MQGGSSQLMAKLQRREIPDVLSWAQCSCSYIGIVVEASPERTKQPLAYLATVLWEARRCGGEGWRSYDAMFRQLCRWTGHASTRHCMPLRFWPGKQAVASPATCAWTLTTAQRNVRWPLSSPDPQRLRPRGKRRSPVACRGRGQGQLREVVGSALLSVE